MHVPNRMQLLLRVQWIRARLAGILLTKDRLSDDKPPATGTSGRKPCRRERAAPASLPICAPIEASAGGVGAHEGLC